MDLNVSSGRVVLENVTSLKPNEIFVFGSNLLGVHGAGAALLAYTEFGAAWGVGVGLTGNSYALPTKDRFIETLPLDVIRDYIFEFIAFARDNPHLHFLVTSVGCGLAGYTPRDIAPFFQEAMPLLNVSLPLAFWDVLC